MAMAERLARFSEQDDALTCSYLTPTHLATAAQIREWMLAAGLEIETDAVGNVIGRLYSANADAPTLITGSHYDTVVNGGKYDGRLGVLLPIAVAGHLKRSGAQLPFTLEIIAFAEEEGVRFKSTFLGSRAVVGKFHPALLDTVDASGLSMRDAMVSAGLDPAKIAAAAHDPRRTLGFVEVHIEQGPGTVIRESAVGRGHVHRRQYASAGHDHRAGRPRRHRADEPETRRRGRRRRVGLVRRETLLAKSRARRHRRAAGSAGRRRKRHSRPLRIEYRHSRAGRRDAPHQPTMM